MLINTTLILYFVDFSYYYHFMKSQSFMKLYVFYNMLEIMERLCRSIGNDLFDVILDVRYHTSPELYMGSPGAGGESVLS